jgi:endonuclease I
LKFLKVDLVLDGFCYLLLLLWLLLLMMIFFYIILFFLHYFSSTNNHLDKQIKSHGFKSSSAHAHTDLHHLTPADVSTNSNRGNTDFKEGGENNVCSSKDKTCCVECKKDGNLTWEPPKVSKGQIARMMFYMDVRYEGNDQGRTRTPDLVLVDKSTKVGDPELGYLSDLLKWHCENPVTDLEKRRNDLVETWQGNRNPFIDRPDLVKAVWNDPKYDSIWENCNENPADVGSNSEDDAQDGTNNDENPADDGLNSEDDAQDGSNNDENPADAGSNSEDGAQDGSNNDENPADDGSNSEDGAQDGSNNDENPADDGSNSEDSVNIVISSALINPSGFNEKGREWVEIKNLGKGNVDLAGWKLSDRKRRGTPITLSGILIPNATKRITELNDENGSVILTNGSGGLFLEDSNGKLIDSSEWNQRPRDDEVLEFI